MGFIFNRIDRIICIALYLELGLCSTVLFFDNVYTRRTIQLCTTPSFKRRCADLQLYFCITFGLLGHLHQRFYVFRNRFGVYVLIFIGLAKNIYNPS